MFLDYLKKKAEEACSKLFSDENLNAVATVATNVLTSIKNNVNTIVDNAIETFNELKTPDTQGLDRLHAQQREKWFDDLLNELVQSNPEQAQKFKYFINWLQTVPYTDVIGYLERFNNGEITIDDNGRIDAPEFYVLPETKVICYKPSDAESGVYAIYTSVEDAVTAGTKFIYLCRVTIPNACPCDYRFPTLYMGSVDGNKNAMRREYIAFINAREDVYKQAMKDHASDPLNQKHTAWRSNVNIKLCDVTPV